MKTSENSYKNDHEIILLDNEMTDFEDKQISENEYWLEEQKKENPWDLKKQKSFKILRYRDGDAYLGLIKKRQIEGLGYYKTSKGYYYIGIWKDNKPSGIGSIYISKDLYYIGNFTDGKKCGVGRIFSKGRIYLGMFKNDIINGVGQFTDRSGIIYKGNFTNEKLSGFGTILNSEKHYRFDGDFKYGEKNGFGREIKNERIFYGTFDENGRVGKGIEFLKEKIIFLGNFLKDRKSGFGYCRLDEFNEYSGEFNNGEISGKGRLINNEGEGFVYTGNFFNGNFEGFGKLESSNLMYVGNFKNGTPHGLGYKKQEDRESYFGYFKDGKRDGIGQEVFQFKHYRGQFKNDLYHGYGIVKNEGKPPIYAYFEQGTVINLVSKSKCEFLQKDKNLNFPHFYKKTQKTLIKLDINLDQEIKQLNLNHKSIRDKIEKNRKFSKRKLTNNEIEFEKIIEEFSLMKIQVDFMCKKACLPVEKELPLIVQDLDEIVENQLNIEMQYSQDQMLETFMNPESFLQGQTLEVNHWASKGRQLREESTLHEANHSMRDIDLQNPELYYQGNEEADNKNNKKSKELENFFGKKLEEIVNFFLIFLVYKKSRMWKN